MTVLQTERLTLRPWHVDEAAELLDIRSRREVSKWLSDPLPWASLDQARRTIMKWASADPPRHTWAIVAAGVPIGSIALHPLDELETEIGWYLHPDAEGKGYAREAATAVLEHAVSAGLERVWAIMWAHNVPSARLAESLGMVRLGVVDDPWYGTDDEPQSLMFRYPR